jgi:2-iminobutanoate/2-iminopropanoate deaminase
VSSKIPVRTDGSAGAIGAYSQGVVAGDLVFTSGQIPMTSDGQCVVGDVTMATRQALANVLSVLAAAGATEKDVVKVTVYLSDVGDFEEVNAVYAETFSPPYPARSCVEVSRLPKDVPIEIEAIARIGRDRAA